MPTAPAPLYPPTPASNGLDGVRVQLDNITLVRGATTVFDGLRLDLTQRRIGLIGDNGAGKSSLFRLICGLDRPKAGHVRVHGPSSVGMMFQNPDEQIIFPTVEEELGLSLQAAGLSRQAARATSQGLRPRQWPAACVARHTRGVGLARAPQARWQLGGVRHGADHRPPATR